MYLLSGFIGPLMPGLALGNRHVPEHMGVPDHMQRFRKRSQNRLTSFSRGVVPRRGDSNLFTSLIGRETYLKRLSDINEKMN